ncbi:hypothetical protein JZ751_028071, partial [Albula glossodonta]
TQVVEYSVEVSMPEHFILPNTISLPVTSEAGDSVLPKDARGVHVAVRFQPKAEGRYRCQVVLRSRQDVRVHLLEAVVHGGGSHAQLEFTVPAHASVTQDIPLNSKSLPGCRLQGLLCGQGFSGPPVVYFRAGERPCYPLTFHPTSKCIIKGHLSLINDTDGTEYSFILQGVGERPLAQGHVQIRCTVQAVAQSCLQVPNHSQITVNCKIKPGHVVPYTISVSPWKRGIHKDERIWPYEVWFSLEVMCSPAPPMKVMAIQCAVHSSVAVEIPITNPRAEPLHLQVCVEGPDLLGDTCMSVPAQGTAPYLIRFTPATVGRKSGRWTRISLPLRNPTDETLELNVLNNNTRNFILELDTSQELGEWVFLLSGTGLAPGLMEPLSVISRVGSHSSLILPFRNPMEHSVLLYLCLTDEEQSLDTLHPSVLGMSFECKGKAFSIPLRKTQAIPLAPEARVDVPVVFAPDCMQRYSAWVVIQLEPDMDQVLSSDQVGKQAGTVGELSDEGVELTNLQQDSSPRVTAEDGSPQGIRWVYPIHGIPEAVLSPSHQAPSEVKDQNCSQQSKTPVGPEPQFNIVTLTFNIVFAPCNPFRCTATLAVQHISGGLWKFPITLISTEPQVDDIINIEVVSPHSGELLPVDSPGTLLTITFTPSMYSKRHQATLLVQTADMQWTYEVNGVLPPYTPPCPQSSKTKGSNKLRPTGGRQRNLLRQNLLVPIAAASSPLTPKIK